MGILGLGRGPTGISTNMFYSQVMRAHQNCVRWDVVILLRHSLRRPRC